MNPAPGWYPDPRPGHTGLHAWWDGRQWHLKANKLTETAEWVTVGIGAADPAAVLTLDRYGHLMPDDLDAVADAFDAAAETTADPLRTGAVLKPVHSGRNSH